MALLLSSLQVEAQVATGIDISRIQVVPGEDGLVLLNGEAETVPPRSDIAVLSLYTRDIAYTRSAADGSFSLEIPGLPAMPFMLASAPAISETERRAGVMPPGPYALLHNTAPYFDGLTYGFDFGGRLAYDAGRWLAAGRISTLRADAGESLSLSLDVWFAMALAGTPPLNPSVSLSLLPLFDAEGQPVILDTTERPAQVGWFTRSGLPISGMVTLPLRLADAQAGPVSPDPEAPEAGVRFELTFDVHLPEELPPGFYLLRLRPLLRVGDSAPVEWYANRLLATTGPGPESVPPVDLPLMLRVGEPLEPQLNWWLPQLESDSLRAGLSLLSPLPEVAQIALNLPAVIPLQNQLLRIDARLNGASLPEPVPGVDDTGRYHVLSITLGDETLRTGDLTLSGGLNDGFGTRYGFDGVRSLAAGNYELFPDVLPGTPLQVGECYSPALRIAPHPVPETTISFSLRFWPLDGEPITTTSLLEREGSAWSAEEICFNQAGEYRAFYELVTDAGRAELLSVGPVVDPESPAIVRGQPGLIGYDRSRPAWYDTRVFPADAPELALRLPYPYFSGDILRLPDDGALVPALQVQNPEAAYRVALGADPAQEALPLWAQAGGYGLLTASRPDGEPLMIAWGGLDAGPDWMASMLGSPGDYAFLFGGALTPELSAGYSALLLRTEEGASVLPAYESALFDESRAFFVAQNPAPGQVIPLDTDSPLTGYAAPPLAAEIDLELQGPDGRIQFISERANPYGFLHVPDAGLSLDVPGVWTLVIQTRYRGETSTGPLPRVYTGGIPGAPDGRYSVYVVSDDVPLATSLGGPVDSEIARGAPLNINAVIPEEWTDFSAHVTLRSPGYVLRSGPITTSGRSIRYTIDLTALAREYSHLADGDPLTLTVFASGLDSDGDPVGRARVYTIRDGRLISPEVGP